MATISGKAATSCLWENVKDSADTTEKTSQDEVKHKKQSTIPSSASAHDLRCSNMEKERQDVSSPKGVLEACLKGSESDTVSSKDSSSESDILCSKTQASTNWRKFFKSWKRRSIKRLATFPPLPMAMTCRRKNRSTREEDHEMTHIYEYKSSLKEFTLSELQIATNNFSKGLLLVRIPVENMIGRGGYAEVYKGCLPNGRLVAVKRLTKGTESERTSGFLCEIGIIAYVDHPNTAKLIGCDSDGMHLVFQLSPLGSLGSLLHGTGLKKDLRCLGLGSQGGSYQRLLFSSHRSYLINIGHGKEEGGTSTLGGTIQQSCMKYWGTLSGVFTSHGHTLSHKLHIEGKSTNFVAMLLLRSLGAQHAVACILTAVKDLQIVSNVISLNLCNGFMLYEICDFGLAKWLPRQWTHHNVSKFEGTFGYFAPEYFMHGVVDEKTDVYAFGVLLLELITGRRAVDHLQQSVVIWAKPLLDNNDIRELVDPSLCNNYDRDEMDRVVLTASLCIEQSPILRPRMSQASLLAFLVWYIHSNIPVVILLRGDESAAQCAKECHKGTLRRSYSEHLLDAQEYNSTRYLSDLNRLKEVALGS
ncbi:hypothetical protein Pint_19933 [Pistacia integerrima]|uniref:Uncharacterized protein n=1 Tax=Pistacia integerrima TaxID=434235 RepID=A0ACC0XFV0_9ROSI|nr:hypothetical protein Pint_19933 [Pistacia integerrima]